MSARKPAHELAAEEKELLVLSIRELREIIKGLNVDQYRADFALEKKRDKEELAEIESAAGFARGTLASLIGEAKEAEALRDKYRSDAQKAMEQYRDITRRLFLDLASNQKRLDDMRAEVRGQEGTILMDSKKIEDINRDIERSSRHLKEIDELVIQRGRDLEKIAEELGEAVLERDEVRGEAVRDKGDNLKARDERREAGMALHDARTYRDRMKPEFQRMMADYLKQHG